MRPIRYVASEGAHVTPWVFVSHSTADKERFVKAFVRRLQEYVRIWIDDQISATDSMTGVVFDEGIGQAAAGLIVLSEHTADSRWMRHEIRALFARKINDDIPLVVVRLDDAPVPPMLVDSYLVNVVPGTDWSAQLGMVVAALGEVAGRPAVRRSQADQLRRKLADPGQWLAADDQVRAVTDEVVRRLRTGRPW